MTSAHAGMGDDVSGAHGQPESAGRSDSARCACGVHWSGTRAAHCSVCHATFGGISGFDAHRSGGQCLDPASKGLTLITRNGWSRWAEPLSDDDRERLSKHRSAE
jgi:hypothetical protein